jgi:hypothetical protein
MRTEVNDGTADESRRSIVPEVPLDGRGKQDGEPRERALTLVEKLYQAGILSYDEWVAGGQLRTMFFLIEAPSEGVSSYGQSTGRADPTRKGDRKAKRLTGIEVAINGDIHRGQSRTNRADVWKYRDAMFAMCGVANEDGDKVLDAQAAKIMLRSVVDSEYMPTQTEIGRARATYIKDDGNKPSKQVTAIGAFFVKEHLRRLAMHMGMIKGEAVK